MKLKKVLYTFVVLALVLGAYFLGQKNSDSAISYTDVQSGKSYAGGVTEQTGTSSASDVTAKATRTVVTVNAGESIQEAVKQAEPGTLIRVMPGLYHETVYVDKDDISLIGVIEKGQRATLDGKGEMNDAILYSGNNFVVENFRITKYKGNAIMGQAGNNFEIRNNQIVDTGVYGIFPQLGKNGIVEYNVVSGIEDAAIYIGMSDNVHVAHNDVFDSVAGIEIENSRHVIVENNYVHNNTGGVLAFITPGLPIKTTYDVIIRNNFISGNNHPNFGAPGSLVAGIPAGTGILIMAADQVVVEDNIISDNKTAAILIADHENSNVTFDPESDPNPDEVAILNNVMLNNGYDTIAEVKALMALELKQVNPDIVAVGGGTGSCIINRHRYNVVGLSDYTECDFTNTDDILTYQLAEPVPPREIKPSERGMIAYLGVCSGCHSYTGRLIGPPVQIIQALYMGDPEGLAAYIKNPTKKRPDFPEMPSQGYLGDETLAAVAEYMLKLEK
jgi:parallel beta-helix repeat protein